jgi:hypothetical protein
MFSRRVLKVINHIFSTHLQLSNGKQLSLEQETRPYVSGFTLGCCNHSTLCVTVITAPYWKETLERVKAF